MVDIGDAAPQFCLPGMDEREVCLDDFKGKWLVLYFYPKDSTSGCTTEAVEFSGLLPRFMAFGADVVGVSRDKPASHRKFIDKNELTVTLLSDPETATLAAYGAWREKKVCGKACVGTVRSTFLVDPKGVVRKSWGQVAKAAGHAEAVLAALGELAGS